MGRNLRLPRLYAIVDAGIFAAEKDAALAVARFAEELLAGGATLIQYRNKTGNGPQMLSQARELRRVVPRDGVVLIMNDRADLCLAAGFDGVHVGQDDLSPAGARMVVGKERVLGLSTHHPEQLAAAEQTDIDYVAIGPVFATSTKENPGPLVGLEGVRRARAATRKPLVAIGGITRAKCRAVLEAGADCVAVVSDLRENPRAATEEFLRILGRS
ncbi:MAG: thiamine phosphate synthase [Candidatus Koribacter versatilis]|uniref:Thiamine-phosphate synthase n=1 Tax=Candidatus Korobacter versatilis TaxID=658062 RepID=A0A932AAA0_9BACT|nr:thiamine phosphate synthase [Candidatus Koribacter versatilis]